MKIINKIIKFIKNMPYKHRIKKISKNTNLTTEIDKSSFTLNIKDEKPESITYSKNIVEINGKNFKIFKK